MNPPTEQDMLNMVESAVASLEAEDAAAEAAFQQRFDIARMVLERKYRWAKLTLRNLKPVRRAEGTLAVDKWLRLYHGPEADGWTDQEFVGCLWHEVNHLLRHHPDRLEHLPKKHGIHPMVANLAADLEINDDLSDQHVKLPDGVMYTSLFPTHVKGWAAEQHFQQFVDDIEQQEKQQQGGDQGEQQEGEGDDEGEGAEGDGKEGDQEGKGGGNQPQQGKGQPGKGKPGKSKGNIPDNPTCSNGDVEPDEAPGEEELGRLDREQRRGAEDIVKAMEEGGGGQGLTGDIYKAAVEFLGKSKHDWRSTFASEVRNAMEQRSDEAEEYTFRRRSRRAYNVDDIILPGSYRPIPQLGVVVDVSGSMDKVKMESAMREVHAILERLAIPSFSAYPTNQHVIGSVTVQTPSDIAKVFEYVGGGTDMEQGIAYALSRGDEVIVVLTDCQTSWNQQGPHGIPVIIGGIRRGSSAVPRWARVVDVMKDE